MYREPTKVRFTRTVDPKTGKVELLRMSLQSKQIIPWPEEADKYKDQATGPKDTPASIVAQVTWTPGQPAFPNALWNEMYRQGRHKGKEARAL
jgi:hypothetical protein